MSFKTTVWLLFLTLLLAAVWWFVGLDDGRESGKRHSIMGMSLADIKVLSIEQNDLKIQCELSGGKWLITQPLETMANIGEVEKILGTLESLMTDEIVTDEQRGTRELTLADYGLVSPRARFEVRDRLGKRVLLLGSNSPLGDLVYVKRDNSGDVYATSSAICEMVPKTVESLRDRNVMRGEPAMTTRLEIQPSGGGFIQLVKLSEQWVIQQPIVALAANQQVHTILKALYSLRVAEFVWDPVVTMQGSVELSPATDEYESRAAACGLTGEEVGARIAVWVDGEEVGRELVLGRQTDNAEDLVYASLRGVDSIYAVDRGILDVCAWSANDLRERRVFQADRESVGEVRFLFEGKKLALQREKGSAWRVVEPVLWEADQQVVEDVLGLLYALEVREFVTVGSTNLAEYGLAPVAFEVELAEFVGGGKAGVDGGRTKRLLVGTPTNENARVVCCKFLDSAEIFSVDSRLTRILASSPVNPLTYRNRTMLSIVADNVYRIVMRKGEAETVVGRDALGKWAMKEPVEGVVDESIIADVLFLAANLRAVRIESHDPQDLSIYGLVDPSATLILRLRGGDGIQKTLKIGGAGKTGGFYAMIQGQDVVFVLSKTVVVRLFRGIVRPRARKKESVSDDE